MIKISACLNCPEKTSGVTCGHISAHITDKPIKIETFNPLLMSHPFNFRLNSFSNLLALALALKINGFPGHIQFTHIKIIDFLSN